MAVPDLPELPAPHGGLAKYIADHPDKPVVDILEPYRRYESQLRTVYAQDRANPALDDPYLNVLPLFNENTQYINTRARNLEAESDEEKSRYIMPLPEDKRRPQGSPATVRNLGQFQKNFNIFSESSLADLDWSNVVAAGSSVVNCLLPVPKEFDTTKRKLREYYHEKFCPASDVDLFLYGLTHEEAIEKIKKIEQAIRDALLNEVTVVRTKYAITIASQYPVRHVQIVLRVYKSISEILTGFDIDAAGGAYDGQQVYVTPRALGSFITQINQIDLTRRSPSYENRLSKYSHRNFEIYWPELDRSRIDPTIFERSFQRTLGLARLLVLERLPTTSAREAYLNKRRQERGRPRVDRGYYRIGGNIKDNYEDEVADWLSEEEVSNYHTFTVPYGEKFHAKRIEKLCYTRDLLLNAEWNQPENREVYLHRHPAFFGRVEDVIEDCCGTCPVPKTPEEEEVAEKEAEIYISGKVSFLIDDPGRQQIGSFNPLTEQDWTDMAYVGNTARLCQSIVDGDIDDVLNWLSQEDADPNKRDYTGRSPLHLAVMASTSDVVKCLVDHGSRLTARLADGRTALHLAAARGDTEIIKILMEKSIENEEAEEERQDKLRKAAKSGNVDKASIPKSDNREGSIASDESDDSDGELIEGTQTETDVHSVTTGSFVKVKNSDNQEEDNVAPEDSEDEPDYYQIDVLAWDVPCSPLHLAIAGGHEDAVKLLCDYGADSILPVKFLSNNDTNTTAILTLTLGLTLPIDQAKSMAQLLLKLGAVSSQAEVSGATAFHRYVDSGKREMVDLLLENDKTGSKNSLNHILFSGYYYNPSAVAPLQTAISKKDPILVLRVLNAGATPELDFDTWLKSAKVSPSMSSRLQDLDTNQKKFKGMEQPIITAVRYGDTESALELLKAGANPNTLHPVAEDLIVNEYRRRWSEGLSLLDLVQKSIDNIKKHKSGTKSKKPQLRPGIDGYLSSFQSDTYQHWVVSDDIKWTKDQFEGQMKSYEEDVKRAKESEESIEKNRVLDEMNSGFQRLLDELLARGAKKFTELYPNIKTITDPPQYGQPLFGKKQEDPNEPYNYKFIFKNDTDMNEKKRDGYIKLFEAAWAGDLETIKSLTLQAWGPEQDRPPLKMAINDVHDNTPFSLAFLRGHHEVAKAILEIVKAQWSPREKDKVRYKLASHNEDDGGDGCCYSDSDSDSAVSDDGADPQIVTEKMDQKFTVEDVGKVSMQVESHTKPERVVSGNANTFVIKDGEIQKTGKRSLYKHCLDMDDGSGLKLLLDWAQYWGSQKFPGEDPDEADEAFTFPLVDYRWALDHGKTQLLGLIIKRTGAGIPLDHLVKKSGVEMKQKPKYYQGLTVYGKKRKDWATAGRNMVTKTTGLKTPPLLHAALAGNIDSVEFLLSDAPNRLYSEFGKSKAAREDTRLKHLKDSPGGFDRAIAKWLGADNDLVIHCAVIGSPGKQANELLDYLVQVCPAAIEKKNTNGDTPLMVACRLGRHDFVKILVEANADQSTRNQKGENIIHAVLSDKKPGAHRIRAVLDELDPELRASLFLQRTNLSENGLTPLQAWVFDVSGAKSGSFTEHDAYRGYRQGVRYPYHERAKDVVEIMHLLLEYSEGQGLDLLNAAGDSCLHNAIMYNHMAIAKALINFSPSLLYRENAVGRTPAEVAAASLRARQFKKPDQISPPGPLDVVGSAFTRDAPEYEKDVEIRNMSPETVKAKLEEIGLSGDYTAAQLAEIQGSFGLENKPLRRLKDAALMKQIIWDLCSTAMRKHPGARRLVSLNEANDVARRLGEQQHEDRSRYFSVRHRHNDDQFPDEDKDEDKEDNNGDFSTQMPRFRGEWLDYDEHTGKNMGFEKCAECDRYHD